MHVRWGRHAAHALASRLHVATDATDARERVRNVVLARPLAVVHPIDARINLLGDDVLEGCARGSRQGTNMGCAHPGVDTLRLCGSRAPLHLCDVDAAQHAQLALSDQGARRFQVLGLRGRRLHDALTQQQRDDRGHRRILHHLVYRDATLPELAFQRNQQLCQAEGVDAELENRVLGLVAFGDALANFLARSPHQLLDVAHAEVGNCQVRRSLGLVLNWLWLPNWLGGYRQRCNRGKGGLGSFDERHPAPVGSHLHDDMGVVPCEAEAADPDVGALSELSTLG
mmetsp:Transcript_83995/g.151580  ORF Transcript_83995/g.151580 Transcript_83995/m.151580 type:complete len:284 (+) Transcript_83995:1619-2470(+)